MSEHPLNFDKEVMGPDVRPEIKKAVEILRAAFPVGTDLYHCGMDDGVKIVEYIDDTYFVAQVTSRPDETYLLNLGDIVGGDFTVPRRNGYILENEELMKHRRAAHDAIRMKIGLYNTEEERKAYFRFHPSEKLDSFFKTVKAKAETLKSTAKWSATNPQTQCYGNIFKRSPGGGFSGWACVIYGPHSVHIDDVGNRWVDGDPAAGVPA